MRKIFASILVLAVAITCFSMVAFAAPTTDVYFGTEGLTAVNATEENTYQVDVYYDPSGHAVNYDGIYYIGAFQADIAVEGGTNTTTKVAIANLDNTYTSDSYLSFTTGGDSAELTGPTKVATFTIKREGTVAETTVTIKNCISGDYDGEYTPTGSTLTITWPSSEPAVPAEMVSADEGRDVIVGKDHTYGGIWIGKYVFNANDDIITSITLDFTAMNAALEAAGKAANKSAEPVKTYTFKTGEVKGDGTTNCNIAIVGIPDFNYVAPTVTLNK